MVTGQLDQATLSGPGPTSDAVGRPVPSLRGRVLADWRQAEWCIIINASEGCLVNPRSSGGGCGL